MKSVFLVTTQEGDEELDIFLYANEKDALSFLDAFSDRMVKDGIEYNAGIAETDIIQSAITPKFWTELPNKPTPPNHPIPIDTKPPNTDLKKILDHIESELRNVKWYKPYNPEGD